jgi:hypothetical protein
MKSQAVLSLGAGIPGVSGELKAYTVPTPGVRAKLPGVVPAPLDDGLFPRGGRVKGVLVSVGWVIAIVLILGRGEHTTR